jgi:integrase
MTAARPAGLIQRYREELQARPYARRTVKTYEQWLRRFLRFHGLRHPREMGSAELNAFLTHLAVVRARTRRSLPVVLTPGEARAVLERMDGAAALVAGLLYGSGLRLMEAFRLRVKDLDFERCELTVRDGKGGKDRRTLLPSRLGEPLRRYLGEVRRMHRNDLADGYGRVQLPQAWQGGTPMRRWSGDGNGCFLNTIAGVIPRPGSRAGTTWIRAWFRRR